jgi:hypothetical protein
MQAFPRRNLDGGEDLRNQMAWANEIDVMATPFLQLKHHGGDVSRPSHPSHAPLTDFPVLAKDTAEIAPTEKDCPRSVPAPEHGLLSMVRPETMNDGLFPHATDGSLDRKQAIHMAVPGA